MIKVLHIVYIMNRGGQETLVMNLLRNIDRQNVHFDILSLSHGRGDYDDEIVSLGSSVLHLSGKQSFFRDLVCFFRSHRDYDIIHIHNRHAYSVLLQMTAARLAGYRKFVVHSHSSDAPRKGLHMLCRWLLSFFRFEKVACSGLAARWLFGKAAKVRILRNGIDVDAFRFDMCARSAMRESLGIGNRRAVLHVGRFCEMKNHRFILEVFAELMKLDPDSVLLLAGEGELMEPMQALAVEKGIAGNVMFLGLRPDIPELMSAADVFLFPSIYEGLPLTLVEAQCSGLECHISDTISDESVISDLCHVHSLDTAPQEWARCILESCRKKDTPGNREAAPGAVISHGFDIRSVARELEDFYFIILRIG